MPRILQTESPVAIITIRFITYEDLQPTAPLEPPFSARRLYQPHRL